MSILMGLLLAMASGYADAGGLRLAPPASVLAQEGGSPAVQGKERIVIHKDGGPGRGPDQPFSVREQGASDLEGFLGGKYVVFEGGYDFVLLALLIVVVVVVLVLVL